MAATTITKADAGKTITVSRGETIAVNLDENPTTGFRWEVRPDTDSALELLDSEYTAAPKSLAGGGGQRLWKFKAKESGQVRLVLERRRAGSRDASVGERFEITLEVKN